MSESKDWQACGIWKTLNSRSGEHVKECIATLILLMPDIQRILVSGNTSPKDFTLHDADHSFRVAQRALEIVGGCVEVLSVFDLTLLLLAAYLHDIGMTPEFKKVDAHFKFLLAADEKALANNEIADLQEWLDDHGYLFAPPIPDSLPDSERIALAREITTHYCRSRHNDWGAEWIRENLSRKPLGNYSGWVDDLILLCRSHHFGHDELAQQIFSPRRVANPSSIINLRFLALSLRMADILDFDPERTPDVILRHRDVANESIIFWWKDPPISLTLSSGRIGITARPSSARIQKAIEETADSVDAELALCRKIADDIPLSAIPGEADVSYSWRLTAAAHRNIEPRERTYEYIDGAFRPDTKKLLSLLSGTALYRSPLDAVRELVQNAFDAVGELVAHKRLDSLNPSSSALARELAGQHRVSLQLEIDGVDTFLTCNDNGIGMTKAIIRDRVLVSGSSARHDVRALERLCRAKGFMLGRSGTFGIGILSYFMIATSVEIETLRAQEAGDTDSTRWHFETEGVGSFGELRKTIGHKAGTKVRLRLNREISKSPENWYRELRSYLDHTLVNCPCEFLLGTSLPGCPALEIQPGWSTRDNWPAVAEQLQDRGSRADPGRPKLLSNAAKQKKLAADQAIASVQAELKSCLRWLKDEGAFSDGSGHYEIEVPYFELEGGACLAFLRTTRSEDGKLTLSSLLNGTHFRPHGRADEAWKGMAVWRSELGWRYPVNMDWSAVGFLRVNWTSSEAGEITASRNLLLGNVRASAQAEVDKHYSRILSQFLKDHESSSFAYLNKRLTGLSAPNLSPYLWLRSVGRPEEEQSGIFGWDEIEFPAISRSASGYYVFEGDNELLEVRNKPMRVVPWSVPAPNSYKSAGLGWNSGFTPPDHVVILDSWHPSLAPIWTRSPKIESSRTLLKASFPPVWGKLCGARFEWYSGYRGSEIVWNSANPIVKHVTPEAWEWTGRKFSRDMNPMLHREELLSDASKGASWLLRCIGEDSLELWEGLAEHAPEFLRGLLDFVPSAKRRVLLLWAEEPLQQDTFIRVVSADKWKVVRGDIVDQYLPAPADAWRIRRKGFKSRYWREGGK